MEKLVKQGPSLQLNHISHQILQLVQGPVGQDVSAGPLLIQRMNLEKKEEADIVIIFLPLNDSFVLMFQSF